MDRPPWTTNVNCQGPNCQKTARVNQPGEVRKGWMVLLHPQMVLEPGGKQAQGQAIPPKHYPFCSFTCAYNWVAARLPSKRGSEE